MADEIEVNLWTDDGPVGAEPCAEDLHDWAVGEAEVQRDAGGLFAPPAGPDRDNLADPRVGYGIIVPADSHPDTWSSTFVRFIEHRGAKIFRPVAGSSTRVQCQSDDHSLTALDVVGGAKNQLPAFLLIVGGPDAVSWQLQFSLAGIRGVGRLPIQGPALDRYLESAMNQWNNPPPIAGTKTMGWSVDSGDSITRLMKQVIVDPLSAKYQLDSDLNHVTVHEAAGDPKDSFVRALETHRPRLLVSTHHGRTPSTRVRADQCLGSPITASGETVGIDELSPSLVSGLVWYSHACCGAGSLDRSAYSKLLRRPSDSRIRRTLETVASFGNRVAPLPVALLSSREPIAAFIGQVEPTFNWTLRQFHHEGPATGALIGGMYEALFRGHRIGRCLSQWWLRSGTLASHYESEKDAYNRRPTHEAARKLAQVRVTLRDVRSTVLLGDPAIALVAKPSP